MSLAVVSFPTLFAHNETRGLFAAKLLFRHVEFPTKFRQIPFLMHIGEFVLCLSAFMAVLLILLLCLKKDRNCDTVASGRLFLGALLSIITPTRSIWPTQYSSYALRRSTANSCLSIPLRTLHRDILNDVIELRQPAVYLPLLLKDEFQTTSGIRISLKVDFSWWLTLIWWIISCEMLAYKKSGSMFARKNPLDSSKTHDSTCSDRDTRLGSAAPSSLFLDTLHDTNTASLDCIPHHLLESYIRDLQPAVVPGTCLVLGLTTCSSTARRSFWTNATIFTAIPFLPRRSQHGQPQRTTTPLFASVPAILQLLTTGPVPLAVEVVRNVSREYAGFLGRCADFLESDPECRANFVDKWGRSAWIEERLNTRWEAALVDAGLLEGWAIVVSKPMETAGRG